MMAISARLPVHVDGNAVMRVLNIIHKGDVLRVALTPRGEEVVLLVHKGAARQHKTLDQALLWFGSAADMLDCLCVLGVACSMAHLKPVDWLD